MYFNESYYKYALNYSKLLDFDFSSTIEFISFYFMKKGFFLLIILFTLSCKEEVKHDHLVLDNLSLFQLYDTSCESWLEQKYSCSTDSCFSSAAVEIVGIDTSDSNLYQIYAWSWSEQFIQKNNQDYSGNKQLLIAKFTIDPTTRAKKVMNVFIANPEIPIEEQLTENGFPTQLIKEYFINQSNNIETIRIKALTKKATDKLNLYKENVYTPDSSIVIEIDNLPVVDSLVKEST